MKNHIQEYFEVDVAFPEFYEPYYHHSGFNHPNLYIIKMDEQGAIYPARWGYIPKWGMADINSSEKRYNTLNIKSEKLFTGISKEDGQSNRCLILADGFFEPHKIAGESIPYFCYIPSNHFKDGRHLFAFGGIYSELEKSPFQFTCSLLTMEANPFFEEIHNVKKRQPFVIDEAMYDDWLNPDLNENSVIDLIKDGFTSREFKAHPVRNSLYNRKIDSNKPSAIEEIPPPNLLF